MAVVKINDVSLFRRDKSILENITWQINESEHWALLGPNGSGKTTLLKIIAGIEWPSSGSVKILDKEFGKTDLRELRKHIGWVSSYLTEKIPVNELVINVVISGKYSSFGIYEKVGNEVRKDANRILEFMHCKHLHSGQFKLCSQGEKQKILIARALIASPSILILDEPCTGLDPKARKELLDAIRKICREKMSTIIYVTHHIEEIIEEVTHVLMLKDGKIFKKDTKKNILFDCNIKQLFGIY